MYGKDTIEVSGITFKQINILKRIFKERDLEWDMIDNEFNNCIINVEYVDQLTDWLDDRGIKWRLI